MWAEKPQMLCWEFVRDYDMARRQDGTEDEPGRHTDNIMKPIIITHHTVTGQSRAANEVSRADYLQVLSLLYNRRKSAAGLN